MPYTIEFHSNVDIEGHDPNTMFTLRYAVRNAKGRVYIPNPTQKRVLDLQNALTTATKKPRQYRTRKPHTGKNTQSAHKQLLTWMGVDKTLDPEWGNVANFSAMTGHRLFFSLREGGYNVYFPISTFMPQESVWCVFVRGALGYTVLECSTGLALFSGFNTLKVTKQKLKNVTLKGDNLVHAISRAPKVCQKTAAQEWFRSYGVDWGWAFDPQDGVK